MSSLSPPPVRPTAIDHAALRLVLFGMPDAGKSSLLGALSQASETQERVLHGHLIDQTNGLTELRHRVYEDRQRETQEEIVPYPVRFSPYGEPSEPAVLFDCDGRTANALLTQKRSLTEENREGTLAGAVLSADALILTIDASAPPSQVEDDFREFLRFLRFLEQHRGREHAVGGLPVYLVLTKCDLLARDGSMSRTDWEDRIAERKRDVAERFKAFLAGSGVRNGQLAFGTIDLEVRATAVRKPALSDASPQPREPVGVAELFHSAFEHARIFRERRAHSHKRMLWTVAGAGVLLGGMVITGVALLLNPQTPTEFTLADRVEALRASEGPTAATRLGAGVDRRMKEWLAIQSDPGFPQLPGDLQALVRSRLEEEEAYVQFRDDVGSVLPPDQARSLAELNRTESKLMAMTPPGAYAAQWGETEAIQERDRWVNQASGIREAVSRLKQFYFTLANRATAVLQSDQLDAEWDQRARELLAAEKAPPVSKADQGSADEFEDVALAEADWRKGRDRVAIVRELAKAIGMFGEEDRSPLAFQPLPQGADIESIGTLRWNELRRDYPTYDKWTLSTVPDAMRPEFEKRLRRSLDRAIGEGQRVVVEGIESVTAGKNQMPADWARVGEFLVSPALRDWRQLVAFTARLLDPKAEDPVAATADFLRRKSFDLEPKQFKLRIPDTLSDARVKPAGDFSLSIQRRDTGGIASLSLRQSGEPERDKQSLVYTFTAVGGAALTYRPGDSFTAELPVQKGNRDLKLTWVTSRTSAFQFEKLMREPRLHESEQSATDGQQAVGVTVSVTDGKFPTVPAMIPVWPPEKK